MDEVLGSSISVIVMDRRQGSVDGNLLKVGTAMTVELGIKVRKDTSLQQRVVGEINTTNNVARLKLPKSAMTPIERKIQLTMTCSVSAK